MTKALSRNSNDQGTNRMYHGDHYHWQNDWSFPMDCDNDDANDEENYWNSHYRKVDKVEEKIEHPLASWFDTFIIIRQCERLQEKRPLEKRWNIFSSTFLTCLEKLTVMNENVMLIIEVTRLKYWKNLVTTELLMPKILRMMLEWLSWQTDSVMAAKKQTLKWNSFSSCICSGNFLPLHHAFQQFIM